MLRLVAGHKVARFKLPELRLPAEAFLAGVGAAGGKAAAGLGVDGGGELALHHDALYRLIDVSHGNGGQKGLSIGVHGLVEKSLCGGFFHQLTQIHDADVVTDVPYH